MFSLLIKCFNKENHSPVVHCSRVTCKALWPGCPGSKLPWPCSALSAQSCLSGDAFMGTTVLTKSLSSRMFCQKSIMLLKLNISLQKRLPTVELSLYKSLQRDRGCIRNHRTSARVPSLVPGKLELSFIVPQSQELGIVSSMSSG